MFRKILIKMRAEKEGITLEEAERRCDEDRARDAAIRAANDGHLATPGIPYLVTKAIRRRGETAPGKEVRVVFEIHPCLGDLVPEGTVTVKVVEGAVTGYESWIADEYFINRGYAGEHTGKPFYLCAGGSGWDELFLEVDQAERMFQWVRSERYAVAAATA